jgi:hypothetical protein
MSYIDSIDHEFIGKIGYLPIYHPLENLEGEQRNHQDFSATTQNLILGGGSGEYPSLVFHKLSSVVSRFLYFNLTEQEMDLLSEEEEDYICSLYYVDTDEILEFCGWTARQYSDLLEMSRSKLLGTPLSEDEDVEDWLIRSIGELIFFSLKDLNPEHERLEAIFKRFGISAYMNNVVCIPPGYPKICGRVRNNGELQWGHHRW